ncbi:MAG TPA: hypothetical protein VFF74_09485 [Methylophilaceae bacterium]|nr:hypothetical protein [Methylophilaceae bacterium]
MKKTFLIIALFWSVGCASFQSKAGVIDLSDKAVYFDASRRADGKVEVKFVLLKSTNKTRPFAPTQGFSIVPDVQQKKCGTEATKNINIQQEYLSTPLYDFSDKAGQLPIQKLPVFFATVVSAELERKGLAKIAQDSLPYHTCTRLLWEQLLGL